MEKAFLIFVFTLTKLLLLLMDKQFFVSDCIDDNLNRQKKICMKFDFFIVKIVFVKSQN